MKPKNKIFIISVIFGLMILALIIFLIYPLFKEIKKNSQVMLVFKEELILLRTQIKELKEFGAVYENYQPNLAKINQLFFDSKNPVKFIRFLEKTAFDSGVSIEISPLIFPKKEKETKLWDYVTFKLSSKGSFPNFLKFSDKLEVSPYLTEIQNLTLKRLSEKELKVGEEYSLGDITATCLIKVFTK